MKRIIFLIFIILLVAFGITFTHKEDDIPDIEDVDIKAETAIKKEHANTKNHLKSQIPKQNVKNGYRALTFEIPTNDLPKNFKIGDFLNVLSKNKKLLVSDIKVLNLKTENVSNVSYITLEIPEKEIQNFVFNAIKSPVIFNERDNLYSFYYKIREKNLASK